MFKKPEKFLIYLTALCLVLGIVYYFSPKKKASKQLAYLYSPEEWSQMVGIDVTALTNQFKSDILAHPTQISELNFGKKGGKASQVFSEFPVSAIQNKQDLLVYNIEGQFLAVAVVEDYEELKRFLVNTCGSSETDIYTSEEFNICAKLSEDVLIFNLNSSDTKSLEWMQKNESNESLSYKSKGLVVKNQGNDLPDLNIGFEENKVHLSFSRSIDEPFKIKEHLDLKASQKGMTFTLNGNLKNNPIDQVFLSDLGMNIDSVFSLLNLDAKEIDKQWTGGLYFDWKESVSVEETVVSYEYDDEFNKIEKLETINNVYPSFDLILEGSGLTTYLSEISKLVIKDDAMQFMGCPFPVYAFLDHGKLTLSTQKQKPEFDYEFDQKELSLIIPTGEMSSEDNQLIDLSHYKQALCLFNTKDGSMQVDITMEHENPEEIALIALMNHLPEKVLNANN